MVVIAPLERVISASDLSPPVGKTLLEPELADAPTYRAADDVGTHGGLVDEARVNRVRYLEGVPRSAIRWVDTGWAIAAWLTAREEI
jgi:hypothetical protein